MGALVNLAQRFGFASKVAKGDAVRAQAGALSSEVAVEALVNFLTTIPDPDTVLRKAGVTRAQLAVLEGDDEIYGALETRRDAVIATPWHLEPQEGTLSKFVEEALTPVLPGVLRAAWKAVPYGFSVSEVVWKQDGGRIVPDRAGEKPLKWFEPQRDGTLKFYPPIMAGSSGVGVGQIVDTQFKFLLTQRNPTYENPYGEALLSRLYWAFYFRHNGTRFWAQFLERFGNPLILAKSANPKGVIDALRALGIDAAISVGAGDDIEAIVQAAAGEFDLFDAAMARRVQKLILGQTLTSDTGKNGGGSMALGKVHNLVRMDKKAADLTLVVGTVQRLIDAIVALNFPGQEPPVFTMADTRGLEADRAERDERLAKAGIVKFTEQYLLDRYDFNEGDFEIPENVPPPNMDPNNPNAPQPGAKPPVKAAASAPTFTPEQRVLERVADDMLASGEQAIDPKLLRSAILAATDPNDLAERLAALMPGVTGSKFASLLERCLFAADVIGFVHASEQAGGTAPEASPTGAE